MGVLKAKVDGEWVPVTTTGPGGGGGGGVDEVAISDADPGLTYELWFDPDATSAVGDTGPSTDAGNDLTIGVDQRMYFDHDTKYRDHIPKFADVAARDAAIPAPVAGQLCAVVSTIYRHTGAAWSTAVETPMQAKLHSPTPWGNLLAYAFYSIAFTAIDYDPLGMCSPDLKTITIPPGGDGIWHVEGRNVFGSHGGAGEFIFMDLLKNDLEYTPILGQEFKWTPSRTHYATVSADLKMVAGDRLNMRLYQATTSGMPISGHLSARRVSAMP